MKKRLFFTAMFVASVFTANAQNDEVSNQTVLDLLKEGFTSEEIIGRTTIRKENDSRSKTSTWSLHKATTRKF